MPAVKKADIKVGERYVLKGQARRRAFSYYDPPSTIAAPTPPTPPVYPAGADRYGSPEWDAWRKSPELKKHHEATAIYQEEKCEYGRALLQEIEDSDFNVVELLSRPVAEVLELDVRVPGTSTLGVKVKMARGFHPKLNKDAAWDEAVVPYANVAQSFKDWLEDVKPVIGRIQEKVKGVAKRVKEERRKAIAEERKAQAEEKKREAEAKKARAKQAAETRKRLASDPMLKQEMERYTKANRVKDETQLRTILANFGINDSDGWRGVNTKERFSQDAADAGVTGSYGRLGYVQCTYVRHLTVDDVLRLTGGKTEPPAKTKARKATTKKEGK